MCVTDMLVETYVVEQLLRMMNSAVGIPFLLNVMKIGNLLLNFLHLYVENYMSPLYSFAQYDRKLDNESIVFVDAIFRHIHVPNDRDYGIYN
jgi:hypothetical protein